MATKKPSPISVRRDAALDADLATVMRTGMTQTEAVKYALSIVAQGLDWMWDTGHVQPGKLPRRVGFRVPDRNRPDQRV